VFLGAAFSLHADRQEWSGAERALCGRATHPKQPKDNFYNSGGSGTDYITGRRVGWRERVRASATRASAYVYINKGEENGQKDSKQKRFHHHLGTKIAIMKT